MLLMEDIEEFEDDDSRKMILLPFGRFQNI